MSEKTKKEDKKKKNNSIKIRSSRRVYIPFYVMVIFIILFILIIKITGKELNSIALVLLIVFIVLVFKLTEIHRLSNFYSIGENSLICSKGIFTKNIKRIDYFGISDINIDQGVFQRLFDYGNVIVSLFSADDATMIKNINNPEELARKIEKAIACKRGLKK